MASFHEIISSSLVLSNYYKANGILSTPIQIVSQWRSENEVFKVETDKGLSVLKRINQSTWEADIDHLHKMSEYYPGFTPRIYIQDGPAFIMEYIPGHSLQDAMGESVPDRFISKIKPYFNQLKNVYDKGLPRGRESNGTSQLFYTLRYKSEDFERPGLEIQTCLSQWEPYLRKYPSHLIHNDLNSANLIISGNRIKSIDPRADGYFIQDVAKDIGRIFASMCTLVRDHNYPLEYGLSMVSTITKPWNIDDDKLPARTAFYVGQSLLSFSRWNTKTLSREKLYRLGHAVLSQGPKEYVDWSTVNSILLNCYTI